MGREDARALVREPERDRDHEQDDDSDDADLDLDYSPEAALYKPTDNISLGLRGRRSPLPGARLSETPEEVVMPVYVTIHRIRRLVLTAVGPSAPIADCPDRLLTLCLQTSPTLSTSSESRE